jgi:hypothetical protein
MHIDERYQTALQMPKCPASADHGQVLLCFSSEGLVRDRNSVLVIWASLSRRLPNVVLHIYRSNCGICPKGSLLLMATAEGRHNASGGVRVREQSRNARKGRSVAGRVWTNRKPVRVKVPPTSFPDIHFANSGRKLQERRSRHCRSR